jgi:DNA-binding XRE family transcriptional regulator
MSATVTLFTDRPGFEPVWRTALESHGLHVRTSATDAFPESVENNTPVVIDAASEAYDEDEVLTALGFARAVGAIAVTHLPEDGSFATVDDVVDEICFGMVARSDRDVTRVAASIARRLDRARAQRFEFVTVSPRSSSEVLVVLGDGNTVLIDRPLNESDDGSEIVSIGLAEDATTAALELQTGVQLQLRATGVRPSQEHHGLNGGNGLPLNGAKLGQRLRELRRGAGLTQAELARRTGIHRPNIARVEAGRHTPSLDTLNRLASAIGVSTTQVLSEE